MLISKILIFLAKVLLGIHVRGRLNSTGQKIYFANHTSHIDTVAIMAALPETLRKTTRPVAAKKYWGKNAFLHYIATKGLNAVLLSRQPKAKEHAWDSVYAALDAQDSIIIFPEGTRGCESLPSEFKAGIYHLAKKYPNIELVPVYLDNIYRSMPKGRFIPLPLICSVKFGEPLQNIPDNKADFLEMAQNAVIGLHHGE